MPDDSESEDDSDDSPSKADSQHRTTLDSDSMSSSRGMAIPDPESHQQPREREREQDFGMQSAVILVYSTEVKRRFLDRVIRGMSSSMSAGGDLKTGYMEKRIGEHSSRQNLPELWKWQKRYFVLSEPKGLLYYFKSADDPPTYRGIINIRDCKVEDVDANGLPKTASRSKYDLDGGGGTVSLLIRVSHKVRAKLTCVSFLSWIAVD